MGVMVRVSTMGLGCQRCKPDPGRVTPTIKTVYTVSLLDAQHIKKDRAWPNNQRKKPLYRIDGPNVLLLC